MAYTYLVPSDTARILTTHAENCQNLALIFGRYIPHEAIRNDDILNDRGRATDKVRSQWLNNLLGKFTPAQLDAMLSSYLNRWFAMTENALRFEMRLRGRMAVGLGGKNPMEFGITLNTLTGLPHIPGSALKGLARSYALLTLAGQFGIPIETEPLEKFDEALSKGTHDNNLLAKHYHLAFGTQADAGGCVFYDAVVSNIANPNESLFVMDVMTPHFVKYYTADG
ncbi:MAG TPA: type III-B CRISPR module RAMP protein Cmr6, partial [Aggregatilineales bacterium]|nr:type III-B CRISPR module RAMP protein Cmr6 [Aggregatilineales bacterium]